MNIMSPCMFPNGAYVRLIYLLWFIHYLSRHRCPHNRGSLGQNPVKCDIKCVISEYQTAFERWPYQLMRGSLKPVVKSPMGNIPMDMLTIYQNTYKPHQPQKHIVKAKHSYVPPKANLDLSTTYDRDYTPKDGRRADSYKPDMAFKPNSTKFHTNTMYTDNYRVHSPELLDWCRGSPTKHKECIEMSQAKMEDSTVMKKDFVKHENVERVQLIRPKRQEVRQAVKFNGDTMYSQEYTEKTTERATPKVKPPYKANTHPFEGMTTAKGDYHEWPDHIRETSFKPNLSYKPCDVKFEGKTTASIAYQPWPLRQREKPFEPQNNHQLPGKPFEANSSYQEDYRKPESCERAKPAIPRENEMYFENKDKKPNVTYYQENYQEYKNHQRPESLKKKRTYEAPHDQFSGESMYQANYKGEQCDRAKLCLPKKNAPCAAKTAMQTDTTYMEVYKGRKTAVCPAKPLTQAGATADVGRKLQSQNAVYTLAQMKNGHHFYISEPNQPRKPATVEGTTRVKFKDKVTEINNKGSSSKVKDESEAVKIKRKSTPPTLSTKGSCTCRDAVQKLAKQSMAVATATCTC